MAQYAAAQFPVFLKSVATYNDGSLATALENAFLGFDATLVTEEVKKQLKLLAASGEKTDEEDATDEESTLRIICVMCILCFFVNCMLYYCKHPCVGPGYTSSPLVHLLPHLFPFSLFPFFHWLYLFSSFVHPFPFYQNSLTPFPGRRS